MFFLQHYNETRFEQPTTRTCDFIVLLTKNALRLVNLDHIDKRTAELVHALVRLFMDRLDRARTG